MKSLIKQIVFRPSESGRCDNIKIGNCAMMLFDGVVFDGVVDDYSYKMTLNGSEAVYSFSIGLSCFKINITASNSFTIGNFVHDFQHNGNSQAFSIGCDTSNIICGLDSKRFSIGNYSINDHILKIPSSAQNFNISDGVVLSADLDLTGVAEITDTTNKQIFINSAGDVILVYFDSATAQTIVNLSNP